MSRQRTHRNSLDESSDTSSFDSNEQLSDLEEPEEIQPGKKEKKTWVMRSGPSRSQSDSQSYAPVADDDDDVQYGSDQPSDDGKYGNQGDGYDDDYSTAEKGKKKATQQSQGDYSDGSQDDEGRRSDDQDQPRTGDTKEKKGNNKKIWLWVGIAGIILLLLLLGIYFYWLRSKPEETDSSSSSSSTSSSSNSSSTSAPQVESVLSSAVPSTAATVTSQPVSNSTAATSLELSPVSTPIAKPVPSSSSRVAPTTTSSAEDSATTFFAQITWFNDEDIVTPCGSNPNDGDYVVRVSEELYGDVDSVSPLCGKWVSLYQLETDSWTKATIEGVCTSCQGNNMDLSRATFWALTQNMKLGTTLAQWWWTPKEDRPQNTLESQPPVAQATHKTQSQSSGSAKSQVSNSGFEPVGTEETGSPGQGNDAATPELTPQ